jgi:hypothetical protein
MTGLPKLEIPLGNAVRVICLLLSRNTYGFHVTARWNLTTAYPVYISTSSSVYGEVLVVSAV